MKKTGKLLSAVIPFLLVMMLPAFALHAKASNVAINESNFPDSRFRSYISEEFDSDGNGVIKDSEISEITWISCDGRGISDLRGIEYFTSLEGLYCCNNQISSLNLSSNKSLLYLECYNNRLTSLDTAGNTALKMLYCYDNQLSSLNVSKSTKLEYLHCANNNLGSLNVRSNTKLLYLDCSKNPLGSIDVSRNTALETLLCEEDGLTGLNLSKNTALTDLWCGSNRIASLDLSNNAELMFIMCANNSLNSLNLTSNPMLNYLSCEGNPMKRVEIFGNPDLLDAYLNGEKITEDGITWHEGTGFLRYDSGDTVVTKDKLKPMALTLTNLTGGISIEWEEVTDAVKYRVYKKDDGGNWVVMGSTTGFKYKDSAPRAGYANVYTVLALASDGTELCALGKGTSKVFMTPPLEITLTNKTSGVMINWSEVPGAVKYYIFRMNPDGSWEKLVTTTSLKYTDRTTVYSEKYYYSVRAVSDSGNYINKRGNGTRITYKIPAPELSFRNVEDGIEVSWKPVNNAAKYRLYVKTASGSWKCVTTTTEVSGTDTAVTEGQKYTYAVVGFDAEERIMNDKGAGYDFLRKEEFVKIDAAGTTGGLEVFWDEYEGAVKYRVYRKADSGEWVKLAVVTELSYLDAEASVNAENTYRVLAIGPDGTVISEYGNGKTFTFVIPPTSVGAISKTTGVRLDWEAVITAARYRVVRRTKTTDWVTVGTTAGLSYTDKSAVSGKNYYYAVLALDGNKKALNESGEGILVKYRAPSASVFAEESSVLSEETEEVTGGGIEAEELVGEGIFEEEISEEIIAEEEISEEEISEEEVSEEEISEEESNEEESPEETIAEEENSGEEAAEEIAEEGITAEEAVEETESEDEIEEDAVTENAEDATEEVA